LGRYMSLLKKQSHSHGIRWSKPENLHITLQFLGQAHAEKLPELITNVRSRIEGILKTSTVSFGSLHLFPTPYRPRVIVLDIIPQTDLMVLAELIGQGIVATQYEIENRPFRAHLTLGRIKQPKDTNFSFLNECDLPEFEKMAVNEVILFRSEPQPEGSLYTVIEKIKVTA
jgi:RNA 2',3'-cyclic 3'-phosphodiesterase